MKRILNSMLSDFTSWCKVDCGIVCEWLPQGKNHLALYVVKPGQTGTMGAEILPGSLLAVFFNDHRNPPTLSVEDALAEAYMQQVVPTDTESFSQAILTARGFVTKADAGGIELQCHEGNCTISIGYALTSKTDTPYLLHRAFTDGSITNESSRAIKN